MPKKPAVLIDSKHLKIIALKKSALKDALVFIYLDEEKYNTSGADGLLKIAEQLEQMDPSGVYFPLTANISVELYDKADFKHKDILVTIDHTEEISNDIKEQFKAALPEARSIDFVYGPVKIERK